MSWKLVQTRWVIWLGHSHFLKDLAQLVVARLNLSSSRLKIFLKEQPCSTLELYFEVKWFPDLCVPGLGQIHCNQTIASGKLALILTTFAVVTADVRR